MFGQRIPSKTVLIGLCAVAILFAGQDASAHSAGSSFEQRIGSYAVDIGYDATEFRAGQSVRFDFDLKDAETQKDIDFAQVWVRIVREKETLLATGIFHQPIGPTTLLYTFPEQGNYTLEASFRTQNGGEIAMASFPVAVALSSGAGDWGAYTSVPFSFLGGWVLGAVGARVFRRLRAPRPLR